MRILELVTSGAWGGAQAQVVAISRELALRGHDVHVGCGGPGELLNRAAEVGAHPHRLHRLHRAVQPLADIAAWSEVAALLDSIRPEVLHTHSSKAGVLGRLAGATHRWRRQAALPVVHTCHGLSWGPGRTRGLACWAYRAAEHLTGHLCSHVIAVSDGIRSEIRQQRLYPLAQVVAIHNGTDPGPPGPGSFGASPESRRGLGLPANGTLVIMVARMAPGKGHDLAIDAFVRLRGRVGPVTLVLVGDGPRRSEIEERAARLYPIGSEVLFLGQRDDVPELLRAGDLVLMPSSAEGLPLAAIEAMGACLPVVGLRVAGTSEVVVDGETGILVDPVSPAGALAGAMETLIQDRELAQRMGKAGRARAVARFSLDNTLRVVDLLCDIARCPKPGHSWEVSGG